MRPGDRGEAGQPTTGRTSHFGRRLVYAGERGHQLWCERAMVGGRVPHSPTAPGPQGKKTRHRYKPVRCRHFAPLHFFTLKEGEKGRTEGKNSLMTAWCKFYTNCNQNSTLKERIINGEKKLCPIISCLNRRGPMLGDM